MIKFFRNIRKKLLRENRVSKYLVYALGEIVLVVIGILIALQINNWNEYKKNRIVEKDYLTRILNDLSVDTTNFSWTCRQLNIKQQYLGTLLELVKTDDIVAADSIKVLEYLLYGTYLSIGHPGISSGTFDELSSTGAMQHVTNTRLRTEINNYYFKTELRNNRIEKKKTLSKYNEIVNKSIPNLASTKTGEVSYRNDLITYKEILDMVNTPEFIKQTISEYNNTIFMLRLQEGGLEDSKALLSLVNEVLNNKEGM